MKASLKSVIEDPEYREALRARVIAGKAAHMEQLATQCTIGKPQEQMQVQTTPSMARLMLLALERANTKKQEERERAKAESNPDHPWLVRGSQLIRSVRHLLEV